MRPKSSTKTIIPLLDASDCPAKTRKTPNGTEKGCSVEAHLSAAWMVGKALLDNYHKNFCTRNLFSEHDLIAPLLHDIGKISPAFHDKIAEACNLKRLLPIEISDENHCITSSLVLKHLGLENLAWVAASHHGRYCNTSLTTLGAEWLGGESWEKMRENVIQKLCTQFSMELSDVSDDECQRTLVLGLTILADWLSSGMDLPLGENPTLEMCANTVRNAGFLPFSCKKELSFGKVFQNGDAPLMQPNFFQRKIAENVHPGAVYILEVEMGSGKTEAALYLAYKLISEFQHNGLYFALPTCLTSDKIYDRVKPFLENILQPESFTQKVRLLHGKAWMRDFLSQAETGEKVNQAKDESTKENDQKEASAGDWFSPRKRALLAPFAVGTIDQLLMSVINVKHNALRALGAAGKVIILDEVHSYDAYTGTLIRRLVEHLRQWGCTVVILSATLTQKVRNELLGIPPETDSSHEYPLLSIRDGEKLSYIFPTNSKNDAKTVQIFHSSSAEDSLQSALEHAARGECVLWIENTVANAQKIFRELTLRIPSEVRVGLIHSRFQERARHLHENEWVKLYGKDAAPSERAGGKILVGTQVLEQSIDIDADYLITRHCPTDMFLQRVGRLWRHRKHDALRPQSAVCGVEILNETEVFKPLSRPYDAYILTRSFEVLKPLQRLTIPEDMRTLIENTYVPREETGPSAILKEKLNEEVAKLERFANMAAGTAYPTQNDTEASTRYSEEETVDVLLLEDYNAAEGMIKPFRSPSWFRIPEAETGKKRSLRCAAALSHFIVRVRISTAPEYAGFPLEFLHHILYTGSDKNRPLRAAYVAPDGQLLTQSRLPAKSEDGKFLLNYDEELGYFYKTKGTNS